MSTITSRINSNRIRSLAISLFLLGVLSGCGNNGIEVTTQFSSGQGVKEGAKVYFDAQGVGEVIDVSETESGSLVTMAIDEAAASLIDSNAAVAVNRIKPGAPLEIYARASSESRGLYDGQQLHGLNSMIELVAWTVGDAIQFGSGELSNYVDSFQSYLESEKFEEDRARVEAGVKAMAEVASSAIETVEQDLAEAMSEVSVSEQELANALKELGDDLSPLAEEMAKSGVNLAVELEKFAQGVDDASQEEQESRQKLIDSLIETLEKLNRAAERGAQEPLE